MRTTLIVFMVCASILLPAAAYSGEVVPLSYTSSPHPSGSYPDTSGKELTDGVIGAAVLNDSAWQGWSNSNPAITFTFDDPINLQQIDVHVLKIVSPGVGIPLHINVVAGLYSHTWDFDNAGYTNPSCATLTLPIPGVISDTVKVTLTRTTSWIFCSEVDFYGQPELPVPEPSGLLALASGLVAAGAALRRRLA